MRGDAGVPVRLRFSKHGPVRFISHRDVARAFERAFRIVELPLAFSAGFSPHPKVSFGPALAVGYERLAGIPEVGAALTGGAAASAGLVLGTALKMIRNIRPTPLSYAIGAAGFAAIGLLRWPLVPVVLVLVPTAIAATWWERRR